MPKRKKITKKRLKRTEQQRQLVFYAIPRDMFLAWRSEGISSDKAAVADGTYPGMEHFKVHVVDPGDEIVCDHCNALSEESIIWLYTEIRKGATPPQPNGSEYGACLKCRLGIIRRAVESGMAKGLLIGPTPPLTRKQASQHLYHGDPS